MGRQSSRLYFQGKDHKDIYFQGHYHDAMYLSDDKGNLTLVWEKLKTEDGIEFTPWGINYHNGMYFVLEYTLSANTPIGKSKVINLYTGKSLYALRLRFSEVAGTDSNFDLYFMDCNEYGLEYAFGTYPNEFISNGNDIGLQHNNCSYYRRIPDVNASDYKEEIVNVPGRVIQCKSFGVIFDAEGNFYYSRDSNNTSVGKLVQFYKGGKSPTFKNDYLIPYEKSTRFAVTYLPAECLTSIGFLVEDRITVCCTPWDRSYYSYTEIFDKPFYICGVSVTGDGSDISVTDIKNKNIVYTDSGSRYVPMRISTSSGHRISMLTPNIGSIYVEGTLRSLIVDFDKCEIISALSSLNPFRELTYAYKFNGINYVMVRDYYASDNTLFYKLYYGKELSEGSMDKCDIVSGDIGNFRQKEQLSYAKCIYVLNKILTAIGSQFGIFNPLLKLNLYTGEYKEVEQIAKYIAEKG